MADFRDRLGTGIGDFFTAPYASSFGALMPGAADDPRFRQAAIADGLMTPGNAITRGARTRAPIMESVGQGWQDMRAQGAQRAQQAQQAQQQLQTGLLMSKIGEQQRAAKRREELEKAYQNPELLGKLGPYAPLLRYMLEDQAGALIAKMAMEDLDRQENERTFRGAVGDVTGGGTPAPGASAPQGVLAPAGDYSARTQATESPFRVTNPESGAPGYYQFMPGTAHRYAQQTSWGRGLGQDQVKALIEQEVSSLQRGTVGPRQRELFNLYTADSNRTLQAAGTTDANRYALHWFGPAGGTALVTADPSMPVADWARSVKWDNGASPESVIRQNRLGRYQSVGELCAAIAQKMAPGGVTRTAGQTVARSPVDDTGDRDAVLPAQYTPPAQGQPTQSQPKSVQQVMPGIPPEVLRIGTTVARKDPAAGMKILAPYLGSEAANRKIIFDRNSGQWVVNEPAVEAERRIQAAQGEESARIARQTKLDKRDITDAADEHKALQAAGLKSRTALANVKQLGALLEGIDTGRFKSSTIDIKRMAKGLGGDLDALGIRDDVDAAEAARALIGQMALQLRNPSTGYGMPGAMSDGDREFLVAMVPNLETTPEGRRLMLQYMERLHEHNIALARVAIQYRGSSDWKKNPKGLQARIQEYADANPVFRQEDIDAVLKAKQGAPTPPAQPTQPPPGTFDQDPLDREMRRRGLIK